MHHYDILETIKIKLNEQDELTTEEKIEATLQVLYDRNQHNETTIRRYVRHMERKELTKKLTTQPSPELRVDYYEVIDRHEVKFQSMSASKIKAKLPLGECQKRQNTRSNRKKTLPLLMDLHTPHSDPQITNFPGFQTTTQMNLTEETKKTGETNSKTSKHKVFTSNLRSYILRQALTKEEKKQQLILPKNSSKTRQSSNSPNYKQLSIKSLGLGLGEAPSLTKMDYENYSKRKKIRISTTDATSQKYKQQNEEESTKDCADSRMLKSRAAFPTLSKFHIERNKRCLEMFLKCNQNKHFEKSQLISVLKAETSCNELDDTTTSRKRVCFRVNTLPLTKQF